MTGKLVRLSDQTSQNMQHTTPFYQHNLDELKNMVAHSDHKTVEEIADNWQWVADRLTGGESGGLKAEFDNAVNEVLEYWSGSAAEGFRTRAKLISDNIANAAPYAQNVSNAMRNAASSLKYYKEQLDAVKKPTSTESNMDAIGNGALAVVTLGAAGGRDDSKANSELAAGVPTQDVLNGNSGELSEGKERQLQGAIVMEYLGAAYRNNAAAIGGAPRGYIDEVDTIPPTNHNTPVTPVTPVPPSVSRPKPSTVDPKYPTTNRPEYTSPTTINPPYTHGNTDDIHRGVPKTPTPTPGFPTPDNLIGTGLDSFPPGSGGTSLGGSSGSYGGGGSTGSGSTGLGSTGNGTTSLPGVSGSMLGGTTVGRTGSGAGRGGAPGMGGAVGAGKGGMGAGSGRGALARQKGGVVGAAKGKTGSGPQGGSGLHRSRGGTQAGKSGRSGAGMAGAHGARGRGKGDEEGREGQRPDYLIEDEETWTTERNVAPRVIE